MFDSPPFSDIIGKKKSFRNEMLMTNESNLHHTTEPHLIYADNAATTPLCRTAFNAMLPYLNSIYGNPSSPHRFGQEAAAALLGAREKLAALLGCSARELYFTSGGTEADNQAIYSAALFGAKQGKLHIISTAIEHHAVLRPLEKLGEQGFEITLLPVPENGIAELEALKAALRPDTALVSVMYANNEIGTIQPITEISQLCRTHGVLFHTDAVQAAGHLPLRLSLDSDGACIDYLSLSAHKFCGPKGIGLLYARRGVPMESLIAGGAQERGKRAGTENLPGIVGMTAALSERIAHMDETAKRLVPLRDLLIRELLLIPGSHLNGDPIRRLPGNVNLSFDGIEGESLLLLLDARGIFASSGSACTSGSLEPSHVLLALGRSPALARGSLRLSLGEETTEKDIHYIAETVRECVLRLRG